MQKDFSIALVTGAGSGVGAATARALAVEGFTVVLAGRRRAPLEAVAASLAQIGLRAVAVPADVSRPPDVADLFDRIRSDFGRLDLLFNNAGTRVPSKPIEEVSLEEWQSAVDTNLTGAFLCTQQAVRLMKSQDPRGGRIINNGSISAHVPRPHSAAYTATKHGVRGLTKASSLDCRSHEICVGQIDIGNAATDMSARMEVGTLQANGETVPEPRIDPGHVAAAVVYMATLPLDVNVPTVTVMANEMPYVGRG
jgi:NAD(P)-dependent dehydrogenase (short-subunit alcohol dehydrogenase family)